MDTETGIKAKFDKVRYSNCWEDAAILIKALNIRPGCRCLSIASAGDNSFAMLTKDPAQVIAMDISYAQLAVLELKKICFAEFEYQDTLEFLGFRTTQKNRREIYNSIAKYLSVKTREFWDHNSEYVQQGIIHCGKFENYFRIFRHYVLPLIHTKKKIRELTRYKNLQDRIEFYDEKWNTLRWQSIFKVFFSRFVLGRLGRDPEFFKYVHGNVADKILERTEYALTALSTHDNPYLNYILTGNFSDTLPFYLLESNYNKIRNNIDKLEFYFGPVEEVAAKKPGYFDALNLSDIFEYMDNLLYKNVVKKLLKISNKKCRIAYWNMLAHRKISDDFPDKTVYLKNESGQLFSEDRAFFYKSFYLDEVI